MKKLFLLISLFLTIILSFGQETKYVNTEQLNIRSGAGDNYEVVGKAEQGDKLTVISTTGQWSEIELEDGTKGFVSIRFLSNNSNSKSSDKESSWLTYTILSILIISGLYKFIKGKSTSSNSKQRKKREYKVANEKKATINNKEKNYNQKVDNLDTNQKYYCKDCGRDYPKLSILNYNNCHRSPTGKHRLYESAFKTKYSCKFCGKTYPSIKTMTDNNCSSKQSIKHQPL